MKKTVRKLKNRRIKSEKGLWNEGIKRVQKGEFGRKWEEGGLEAE
jgi:hypothetical protein